MPGEPSKEEAAPTTEVDGVDGVSTANAVKRKPGRPPKADPQPNLPANSDLSEQRGAPPEQIIPYEVQIVPYGIMYRHLAVEHRLTDMEVRRAMGVFLSEDGWKLVRNKAGFS